MFVRLCTIAFFAPRELKFWHAEWLGIWVPVRYLQCCGLRIGFNPDLGFYLNADQDPGSQTSAEPCDPDLRKVEFLF